MMKTLNNSAPSPSPTPKPTLPLPIYTNPALIATASTNEEYKELKKGDIGRQPKLDRPIPGSSLAASPIKKKVAEGIRKPIRTKK